MNSLKWKKYHPLTDKNAFICLVDHMGDDSAIVQAARVSYGKDENRITANEAINSDYARFQDFEEQLKKDRQLIRYLMNHSHTTPFEMVEIKFMVQVPMDCWRQWIRHRTASVNEYSTRYTEALDFFQVTSPEEWRLQATDNKQGSSGYLTEWPDGTETEPFEDHFSAKQILRLPFESAKLIPSVENGGTPGGYLSNEECKFQSQARKLYEDRLKFGIAKEQARKDLPLSTYTRAYWKCDLHNIFNFLRLRMDSHAQLEIRSFANCMFEIVKQLCPVACEAFEDYVLHARRFSRMEMEVIKSFMTPERGFNPFSMQSVEGTESMTDREWKEFLGKLS